MGEYFRPVTINFASVRVAGLGGVPLLVMVVVIAVVFPIARWLLLLGGAAGVALAISLILVRRSGAHTEAGGDGPHVLFREASASTPAADGHAFTVGGRPIEFAA